VNADVLAHWRHTDRFLASASALVEIGDPDSAASRAYYAAFHAVSALFAHEGQLFRKHEAGDATCGTLLSPAPRYFPRRTSAKAQSVPRPAL
jgi:hypothetical protein